MRNEGGGGEGWENLRVGEDRVVERLWKEVSGPLESGACGRCVRRWRRRGRLMCSWRREWTSGTSPVHQRRMEPSPNVRLQRSKAVPAKGRHECLELPTDQRPWLRAARPPRRSGAAICSCPNTWSLGLLFCSIRFQDVRESSTCVDSDGTEDWRAQSSHRRFEGVRRRLQRTVSPLLSA